MAAGLARELPDLLAAMKISPKQSFEIGYNRACALVDTGDLTAAETALKVAMKQGKYCSIHMCAGHDLTGLCAVSPCCLLQVPVNGVVLYTLCSCFHLYSGQCCHAVDCCSAC